MILLFRLLFVWREDNLLNSIICSLRIGHYIKVLWTHTDLNNIFENYIEKEKCTFLVAEAFGDVEGNNVEIIREHQMPLVDVEKMLSENRKGRIIGTVGTRITLKKESML